MPRWNDMKFGRPKKKTEKWNKSSRKYKLKYSYRNRGVRKYYFSRQKPRLREVFITIDGESKCQNSHYASGLRWTLPVWKRFGNVSSIEFSVVSLRDIAPFDLAPSRLRWYSFYWSRGETKQRRAHELSVSTRTLCLRDTFTSRAFCHLDRATLANRHQDICHPDSFHPDTFHAVACNSDNFHPGTCHMGTLSSENCVQCL